MAEEVRKSGADLGVAFDGDADRAIFADEKGVIVDGDHLLAMHALDMADRDALPGNTVVGTLMTNHGLHKLLSDNNLKLIRTKVGDRFVLQEMLSGGYRIGGETSGHLLFLDHAPAGDGMLSALLTVALMRRTGKPLSELASVLRKFPQVLINVPVTDKPELAEVTDIVKTCREVEEALGDSGRVVLRYSGTEPLCRVMVEGPEEKTVQDLADRLTEAVRSSIGQKQPQ
jgi:phosphoglucosamine mutase